MVSVKAAKEAFNSDFIQSFLVLPVVISFLFCGDIHIRTKHKDF
ncbi:hypothetical protein BN1221_03634 [Brenneria goodwinii]|uniref:Uncharacterized protein n=1 Tax=Brenneria goodwinii TaxID=1109412 RepID=A0A0G4JZ67_9GAMM|nr:hypothetical protein BN1221_03634 [Brenneria goodwinii]